MSQSDLQAACIASKSYNYTSDFKDGYYIDAYDGHNWCVATIAFSTKETVDIHYEAWPYKYDQKRIPKESLKLGPFRFHSIGYTGKAYCDFAFDKQVHENKRNVLLRILDSSFHEDKLNMSPLMFTQLLRGELHFYADALLSLGHIYEIKNEYFNDVFLFFKDFFRLIMSWIDHFPNIRNEYEAAKEYKMLYLLNFNTSVAVAYPELIEVLRTCFGGKWDRISKSFAVRVFINEIAF